MPKCSLAEHACMPRGITSGGLPEHEQLQYKDWNPTSEELKAEKDGTLFDDDDNDKSPESSSEEDDSSDAEESSDGDE